MSSFSPPSDAQLMLMSALLDGELSAAEEAEALDALSQNPQLLEAFEAMSAARLALEPTGRLSDDDSHALLASVMAATSPAALPLTLDGALQAAQLAVDGCEPPDFSSQLDALLQQPGAAPAVAGFLASVEASRAALGAVASLPAVMEGLRAVPDHVAALVAADERAGMLTSAALDDALSPAEARELEGLLPDADDVLALVGAHHAGEALRAASASAAFNRLAARAGEAALHAIEAEAVRAAARPTGEGGHALRDEPGLIARLSALFGVVRAPLAFAGAAFALFFVVRSERSDVRDGLPLGDGRVAHQQAEREILDVWTRAVFAEAPASGELPLLADNSADVEAIDSAGNTVVFATESSNITVIWVSTTDEEQGT